MKQSKRVKYDNARIIEAAHIYVNEKCSIRALSEMVNIPKSTLNDAFLGRLPYIDRELWKEVLKVTTLNSHMALKRATTTRKTNNQD